MPIERSEGIVLKTFNWSESSRTVVFFTQTFGKKPLVDKAGRSFRSKRGRITTFTRLELTFYASEKERNDYLSDIEPLEEFTLSKEGGLGRLAYASAACELCHLLLPDEQPQPNLYDYFINFLRLIDTLPRESLPALFVTFFLRLMSQLGYHPSISYCAVCGRSLDELKAENGSSLSFGPERGGLVCHADKRPEEYYIPLSVQSFLTLAVLQRASLAETETVKIGYEEAAHLTEALMKFLHFHAGIGDELKSLEFLEKLKKAQV